MHWPLEAPQEYIDRFANTTGGSHSRNMVCAMIAVLDSGVGNVTAALKSAGTDNLLCSLKLEGVPAFVSF